MDGAGHLDAPDLLPRRRLVKDGCCRLTACQGFLYVPGSRIREEIEIEIEVGIIHRGSSRPILDGCGEGHSVLSLDELFSQFPEFFLCRSRSFGFHEFISDELYSGTGACELQLGSVNRTLKKLLLAGCLSTIRYKTCYRYKAQGAGCTDKATKQTA